MITIKEIKFQNPGVLCADMPSDTFSELKNFLEIQIKNKDNNFKLKRTLMIDNSVSGIEESFTVSLPKNYQNFLKNLSREYINFYEMDLPTNVDTKIVHSWLNLQKPYEYRPLHHHYNRSPNNLSFVTYISIPYDIEVEDKQPNHFKSTIFRNGRIEFLYNRFDGVQLTKTIDIDKNFEGKTIIFSNSLMHLVYPFYSTDSYRISLAGNLHFI